MSLKINTNMAAIKARRTLEKNSKDESKSFERIASGNRITSASDDPAGLAISSKLDMKIRSLKQAQRNANDSVSAMQIAEGSLNELSSSLARLRELAIQSASESIGDGERELIQIESSRILQEFDRIINTTEFNGVNLLKGDNKDDQIQFQVGNYNDEYNQITFEVNENNIKSDALELDEINLSSRDDSLESLDILDSAIIDINETRARFGSIQSQLNIASNAIGNNIDGMIFAKSQIQDTDIAEEVSKLVKNNVLHNAGLNVLVQANNMSASILKLI